MIYLTAQSKPSPVAAAAALVTNLYDDVNCCQQDSWQQTPRRCVPYNGYG